MQPVIFNMIHGSGGNVGLITLNRSQALNAISFNMLMSIIEHLTKWAQDPSIKAVCITGNGDKAFSAGGDIKSVYQIGKENHTLAFPFFYNEYRMNYFVKNYPKPIISLVHGITMGGGIGLSIHCSARVASNDLIWAMPETGIGYFTDVGATYVFSRCANNLGIYLALTGVKLNLTEALYCGFIDYYIPRTKFTEVIDTIAHTNFNTQDLGNSKQIVNEVLRRYTTTTMVQQINHLQLNEETIKQIFSLPSIEQIFRALADINNDPMNKTWAQHTIATLAAKSPTSLIVNLRALRAASSLNFAECMNMEYLIAEKFLLSDDFYEGIRAAVVDKDYAPKWQPATIQEASKQNLNRFFPALENPLNLVDLYQ